MKVKSAVLLHDLMERTRQNFAAVAEFSTHSFEEFNSRITPTSWSVLECIEHLNFYGGFLPS